ncbi:hypothetical protein K2X33_15385 [bacterium]|nr:hypothetical protein [bacterium]
MKKALCFLFLLAGASQALDVQLGLNIQSPVLQAKQAVLLYFGNDRPSLDNSLKLYHNLDYLEAAFRGERGQTGTGKWITPEAAAYFAKQSVSDQGFLKELSYAVRDAFSSDTATHEETDRIGENVYRKNPRYTMGVVLFRNGTLRGKLRKDEPFVAEYQVPGAGTGGSAQLKIDVSNLPDEVFEFPYAEQPLSHPAVLSLLIKETQLTFPPDKFRFVTVFKSQGGWGQAMAPRFDVYVPDIAYEDLIDEVLKHRADFYEGRTTLPRHRGTNALLSRIIYGLSGAKDRKGASASEVFNVLQKSSAEFPLVFFDVNEVELTPELKDASRFPSIGTVFYTDQKVPYGWLSYREVFSFLGVTATDFEVRFREFLKAAL